MTTEADGRDVFANKFWLPPLLLFSVAFSYKEAKQNIEIIC